MVDVELIWVLVALIAVLFILNLFQLTYSAAIVKMMREWKERGEERRTRLVVHAPRKPFVPAPPCPENWPQNESAPVRGKRSTE